MLFVSFIIVLMLWHYRLHSPNLPYLTYGTDLVKTKTKADKMPIVGGGSLRGGGTRSVP